MTEGDIDHGEAAKKPMFAPRAQDVFVVYRAGRGWVSVNAGQIMSLETLEALRTDITTMQGQMSVDESSISDLLTNLESLTSQVNAILDPGIQSAVISTNVSGVVTWIFPHTFLTNDPAPAVTATALSASSTAEYHFEEINRTNVQVVLQVLTAAGEPAPEGVPIHLVANKITV